MKLFCPLCNKEQTVNLIFSAEKRYNTEAKEAEYIDLDFNNAECSECYYSFGNETDHPQINQELVDQGWKAS